MIKAKNKFLLLLAALILQVTLISSAIAADDATTTTPQVTGTTVNEVTNMMQRQQAQVMNSLLSLQKQFQAVQSQESNAINGLAGKVNVLQQRSQQLNSELLLARQQMQAMQSQLSSLAAVAQRPTWQQNIGATLVSFTQSAKQMVGEIGFKLITGLVAIFLLWALWSFSSRSKNKPNSTESKQDLTTTSSPAAASASSNSSMVTADSTEDTAEEGEYDFLNSVDAIPTKLDLARAYITMDDNSSARLVLQEVIAQGNAEQQQLARDMTSDLEADIS